DVVKGLTSGVGSLFKKNKVEHIVGTARLTKANTLEVTSGSEKRTVTFKNVVLATGSTPIQVPGLTFDGTNVLDSTGALALTSVPEKLVIVGGGYIGVELGSVWSRLGSDVTIVEFTDRILPVSDVEMALALQKSLIKQGIKFRFGSAAQGVKQLAGNKLSVQVKTGDAVEEIEANKVIVAVGRRPYTEGLGLDSLGIALSKRGFIEVDSNYRTNVSSVYAIGDVIGKIMLAHNAEEEGVAVAEILAGQHGHVNYRACPSVVYTHPELASVGLTEDQARQQYGQIKIGKFPLIANGRARGMDDTEGFVKVIGDVKTDRLLGVHMLGPHASDVIAEATVAIEFAASVEDIGRSFHAHPTLPEALKEAANLANGSSTQF
ncbi:MAG TPA: dihydrolipoyl dehydrogenase, partial [Tepidisphaeraceae bacterium]|nr:dihydrolipoyl dehydrogenase [Tepidisphaeraceae bacterium]